jgi:hypothetical protein
MNFALETSKILNVCFLRSVFLSETLLGLSSAFELLGLFPFGPSSCTFWWGFLPLAVAAGVGNVLFVVRLAFVVCAFWVCGRVS